MTLKRSTLYAVLAGITLMPIAYAQDDAQAQHDRAEAAQTAHDHRHHTGAKVIGGSAAGGAAVGAIAGGGKGALIGGALGAGGGAVANKVRKDKAVHKRERRDPN
jgi:hypothetical protein